MVTPKLKSKNGDSNSKVKPRLNLKTETKKGILALFFCALVIISVLSAFGMAGVFGQYFLKIGVALFGRGYFLIPVALGLGAVSVLKSLHEDVYASTLFGMVLFVLSFLGLLHIFMIENMGGGRLGWLIGGPLFKILDFWASLIILIIIFLISLLITFNISLRQLAFFVKSEKDSSESDKETSAEGVDESMMEKLSQGIKKMLPQPNFKVKTINTQEAGNAEKPKDEGEKMIETLPLGKGDKSEFKLPPLDLLEEDKGEPTSGDIQANATIIRKTLQNFGIEVEMAEVNVGPTVTQYTLRPAQGVKLTKITALSNDLALSLAAHPIRIEAPIPGRSLVGIEIPNKAVMRVRLRNLLSNPAFREKGSTLALAIGRNVAGAPVYPDLAKMPHMLVAGATGTGKTICLNSLIVSLLCQNTPETLRLILIDPKRVEFVCFSGIPHLLTPVILNPDKAVNALRWCIGEMERRFDLLSDLGARDIISYNQKMRARTEVELMPYLVIVIDELADLMASHGRDIESSIVRLAQMARAVGIHLVVATQRPSVEVITGLIKANITSRVAFQVASQIDSRTILDSAGAEKLLGNGDMLFLSAESSKPRRIQGAFISEKEVKNISDFLKKGGEAEYQTEVLEPKKDQMSLTDDGGDMDDPLYGEAKKLVIEAGKASASLLQRRLRVGYARAARLLDILENNGIIGPGDGAKPREILVNDTSESDI